MGLLLGFLPWILYWALVGNVDFRFAVCIALAVVIGTQLISRIGESWPSLEARSLLIFGAARCLEERAPWAADNHGLLPGHRRRAACSRQGCSDQREQSSVLCGLVVHAACFGSPNNLCRQIRLLHQGFLSGMPVIPSAIIGTDMITPPGKITTKIVGPTVKFGEPLDFSRYEGMSEDRFILRSITDEIMYAIMDCRARSTSTSTHPQRRRRRPA